jgi:hypothetical protein
MKTRFDLEQEIMQVWNLKEDLQLIFAGVCDHGLAEDEDKLANALLGAITLHDMRCEQLFNTFEELIRNHKL